MTSISTSAFLHFAWHMGHYTLQQVIGDGFNTLPNLLLYVTDADKMSHINFGLLGALQDKITTKDKASRDISSCLLSEE
jgi:hypothetical protein